MSGFEKDVSLTGDRGFESVFLHWRVSCEPDFLDQGDPLAQSARRCWQVGEMGPTARVRVGAPYRRDERHLHSTASETRLLAFMGISGGNGAKALDERLLQFLQIRGII